MDQKMSKQQIQAEKKNMKNKQAKKTKNWHFRLFR